MIYRTFSLPIFFVIEKKIFSNLDNILKKNKLSLSSFLIIHGDFLEKNQGIKNHLIDNLKNVEFINIKKGYDINEIKKIIKNIDLIIAIGGGKTCDLGKIIAFETFTPYIIIPTLLSNDGIASYVSIINNNGYKKIETNPPIGVIADIEIIKNSDERHILAGIGDLISNISASLDWKLAHLKNKEELDIISYSLSNNSAIQIIFNWEIGKYKSIKDENFIIDLFYALTNSANAMTIYTSTRPSSGAEHNISHALDISNSKELHGIQTGFATLFTIFLHKEEELLYKIIEFYKKVNFPISFEKLNFSKEKFKEAVLKAPNIRNRYSILNKYSKENILKKLEEFFKLLENLK